jgi:ubiquinone/menaquinone biosynthesis C-methylase UbiE
MPLPTGRVLLDPNTILQEARLSSGMIYADFGSGTLGHFVLPAAHVVGPGTPVYAVDILKSALEGVKGRAELEQVSNVHTVWGDIEKIGGVNIPPESLDVISMVNIASVIKKSPQVFEEAKRLLKSNGKILVVDWMEDTIHPLAPAKEKRMSTDELTDFAARVGMVSMKEFDAGADHWGMLIRKEAYKDYPIKIIG